MEQQLWKGIDLCFATYAGTETERWKRRENAQFSYGEMIIKARGRRSGDCSERSERRHSFVIEL